MDDNRELREYFQAHPPECLSGFRVVAVDPPDLPHEGHAAAPLEASQSGPQIESDQSIESYFRIQCRCGALYHQIHGFLWRNDGAKDQTLWLSPFILECATCLKLTAVFDSDLHGYDAAQGVITNRRGEGVVAVYPCTQCGSTSQDVCIGCEYSDALFGSGDPEFIGREHDLFSWFWLFAQCHACGTEALVAEFKCA